MRKISLQLGIAICLVVFIASVGCKGSGKHAADVKAAQGSTEIWLKAIDNGNYDLSWDESAPLFKTAIKKEEWGKTLVGVRKPLGALVSRKVKSSKYATTLPGAPDGEYVVFEFETSFENKKNATETVTPMKGKDGTWQVAGYYIK